MKKLILLLFLGGIFAGGIWWVQDIREKTAFCTLEGKICPNGAIVGRVPPSCEFSPCDTKNWKSKREGIVEFQYPENLETQFIAAHEWPPQITIEAQKNACKTTITKINQKTYCVTNEIGAAAGSKYITYTYESSTENNTVRATFTIRYPECANFGPEEEQQKCKTEQNSFNLDALIDGIMKTVRVLK